MKILVLKNVITLVDDVDFEWARQSMWYYYPFPGYVVRTYWSKELKRYIGVFLHREILHRMGYTDFEQTDHINRKPLDNRRCNLRVATVQQSSCNRGVRSDNKSGYKGVCWDKAMQKWHARLVTKGVKKQLGYFDTPQEAAKAYNTAAQKYHGEFAYLNEV